MPQTLDPHNAYKPGRGQTTTDLQKLTQKPYLPHYADLVVEPYYPGNGPHPNSGYCGRNAAQDFIAFYVHNKGNKPAPKTAVRINWGSHGVQTTTHNALAPNQRTPIRVPFPPVGSDAEVPFTVTDDHGKQVLELS
jgi:hypothetical protein